MAPDTLDHALPKLKDPALLRMQCYVDGGWHDAADGATHPVVNPASGRAIGTMPMCGAVETRRAIEAASAAWPAWRALVAKDRCAIVRRWYDLMLAHADDLALILTTEQGKPLAESAGEVAIARRVRRVVRRGRQARLRRRDPDASATTGASSS